VDNVQRPDPAFYTRREAATYLRIGSSLLDRLIAAGDVRVVRLRRRVVIPASSLRELERRGATE